MNVVNDNAIPPSLIRLVSKVNGYKKNVVRLLPDSGSSSASANGVIRLKLPTNIIFSCESLIMECLNTFTSTNADVLSEELECYVQRLTLSAGGTDLFSIGSYGDVWKILSNLSMSTQMKRCHYNAGGELGPVSTWEPVGALASATQSAKETAATSSYFQVPLSKSSLGVADTVTVTYDHTGGANERMITFSAAVTAGTLEVGDIIVITGGTVAVNAVVASIVSTTIITVTGLQTDVAATAMWVAYSPACMVKRDKYKKHGNSAYRCAMTNFLSFSDLGWIDSSIFPALTLELQLHGNNVLSVEGGTADATYALSQIEFSLKTLQFSQWSQALYQMLSPDPNTGLGGEVSFKYKRYLTYQFAKEASDQHDLKFAVSSGSLDKLWLTCKTGAYATQATHVEGNALPYYTYSDTSTGFITYLQAFIAEAPYPSYRIRNRDPDSTGDYGHGYAEALLQLEQNTNVSYDNLIESVAEFHRTKWAFPIVFEDLSAGHRDQISGLNSLGQAQNMRFHVECNANFANTNGAFYVIAECSSIAHVSAGRVLRLEY